MRKQIRKKAAALGAVLLSVLILGAGCGSEKQANSSSSSKDSQEETTSLQETQQGGFSTDAQGSKQSQEACEKIAKEYSEKAKNLADMVSSGSADDNGVANFDYLYKTDSSKAKGFYILYASTASADEISVIQAAQGENAADLKSALEARITRRNSDFSGYMPAEVKKIENAQIVIKDDFAILIICDNAEDIAK